MEPVVSLRSTDRLHICEAFGISGVSPIVVLGAMPSVEQCCNRMRRRFRSAAVQFMASLLIRPDAGAKNPFAEERELAKCSSHTTLAREVRVAFFAIDP